MRLLWFWARARQHRLTLASVCWAFLCVRLQAGGGLRGYLRASVLGSGTLQPTARSCFRTGTPPGCPSPGLRLRLDSSHISNPSSAHLSFLTFTAAPSPVPCLPPKSLSWTLHDPLSPPLSSLAHCSVIQPPARVRMRYCTESSQGRVQPGPCTGAGNHTAGFEFWLHHWLQALARPPPASPVRTGL